VNFFNPFPVFHDKTQKSLIEYPLLLSLRLDFSTPPPPHPSSRKSLKGRKQNKYEKKGAGCERARKKKKRNKQKHFASGSKVFILGSDGVLKKNYFRFPSIFLLIDPLVGSHRVG
jgi:hypothetical protein